MLEEALPTLWASVHSWLTPTVLFVLLNVVIGTIAVTSSRAHSHSHDSDSSDTATTTAATPRRLSLDRLKSFSLYSHRPTDAPLHTVPPLVPPEPIQTSSPPLPEPKPTAPVEEAEDPEVSLITRSRSDMEPAAGEMPGKLARKMRKSASAKSAFAHFDFSGGGGIEEAAAEAAEARRPATARVEAAPKEREEDAEVDARADDFINSFRQQLKLQRLDSIVRYKEMLKRGSQA